MPTKGSYKRLFREELLAKVFDEIISAIHSGKLGKDSIYEAVKMRLYEKLKEVGIPLTEKISNEVKKQARELTADIVNFTLSDICNRLDYEKLKKAGLNPEGVFEALSCPLEQNDGKKNEEHPTQKDDDGREQTSS